MEYSWSSRLRYYSTTFEGIDVHPCNTSDVYRKSSLIRLCIRTMHNQNNQNNTTLDRLRSLSLSECSAKKMSVCLLRTLGGRAGGRAGAYPTSFICRCRAYGAAGSSTRVPVHADTALEHSCFCDGDGRVPRADRWARHPWQGLLLLLLLLHRHSVSLRHRQSARPRLSPRS